MDILEKRRETLCLVKQKIDDVLNPSKPNYDPTLTEQDVFEDIGITNEQYYTALSISPDSNYELHLKRPVDSCFINNYFIAGIKGLQPVLTYNLSLIITSALLMCIHISQKMKLNVHRL